MSSKHHIPHLYWRAGFGLSPVEWQERQNWPLQKAIQELFQKAESIPTLYAANSTDGIDRNMSKSAKQELKEREKKLVAQQNTDWVKRMANPRQSAFLERMTLFWHGHFACETKQAYLAAQQLNSIRQHALGNFRDLVLAIAKDPSMIRYLNNQQNKKRQPNENFARELMELFTIGRGNYTEKDIKEAARAFTGWSSTFTGDFVFRERLHDFGQKTFMGKTGNFNGQDIIDIILEKPATAEFITRKIYRYFVNEKVNERYVLELANGFYRSNYNIGQLMRTIFESDWFYDKANIGTKIKSPVELLAGMMRHLSLNIENQQGIIGMQRALGQMLFKPPNVAGWLGGKTWIDNSTLMLRLNLASIIFSAAEMDFQLKVSLEEESRQRLKKMEADIDFQPILKLVAGLEDHEIFDFLANYFIQPQHRLNRSKIEQFVSKSSRTEYVQTLCIRLMSLPEYQMC